MCPDSEHYWSGFSRHNEFDDAEDNEMPKNMSIFSLNLDKNQKIYISSQSFHFTEM